MTATAEALEQVPDVGPWAVSSNEEYHRDTTAISHSQLEVFRRSRPAYHGVYVTGELPRPAPTPQMRLGTALHACLLEPDTAHAVYCVEPVGADRRTKAGKAAWEEFEANANGRIVLCREQEAQLHGMVRAVRRNPVARLLLETPGVVEQALRWVDPPTGLRLKCKPDKRFDSGVLVDVKTAADPTPEEWLRAVARYGYHRQAALYLEGRWHGLGGDAGEFYFLVVGTAPPHDCIVYELDEAAVQLGYRQNRMLLAGLQRCVEADAWHGEWSQTIQVGRLPRWALNESLPY